MKTQVPEMCRIRPFVDFAAGTLTVSAPSMPDLVLPLDYLGQNHEPDNLSDCNTHGLRSSYTDGNGTNGTGECRSVESSGGDSPVTVRVCGNRRAGVTCAASASAWFTRFLGMRCSLVRAAAVAGASDWSNDGSNIGSSKRFADDAPSTNFDDGDGGGSGNDTSPNPSSSGGKEAGSGVVSGIMPWLQAGLGGGWKSASCPVPAARPMSSTEGDESGAAGFRAFANEAPYLLISRASVAKANDMIRRESGNVAGGKEVADGGAESGEDHEQVSAFLG